MFDGVRRAIGMISVKEHAGVITVGGVPADVIARDISKIWNTSRVNSNLFNGLGRSGFSFNSFFAVEIHFILTTLIEHPQSRTNIRALRRIIEELESNTWLASLSESALLDFKWERLKELNVSPLEHQQQFLEIYQRNVAKYQLKGYLLAAAAGSGKTENAIMLSLCLDSDATIVIAPKKAVIEVWSVRVNQRFKAPQRTWTTVDNTPIDYDATWASFHYETLDQALLWLANTKAKRVSIVLDECHNLNDPKSLRTQSFVSLCSDPRVVSVLWMSGTPIKAIGNEAAPFLTTIDTRFTAAVKEQFLKIFGKQVSRAVEILSNRIGVTSYKVAKKEAMSIELIEDTFKVKFPKAEQYSLDNIRTEITKFVQERFDYYKANERSYHNEYFGLLKRYEATIRTQEERAEFGLYKSRAEHLNKRFDPRVDKDLVVWCNQFEERYICPKLSNEERKRFRQVRSVYKYVTLKVRGEALGRILTKRRIECFKAMVPYSNLPEFIDASEKKTLIFTSYVDVVNEANRFLVSEGYKPLLVYGATNAKLKEIMQQFRDDPDANPMIATYDSLAEAVPVTEANTVVLLNQPFRVHERTQAVSRVHRLGQDSAVRVWSTLLDTGATPNISTRSNEIMEWSKASVDAIMGLDSSADILSVESLEELVEVIPQASPLQVVYSKENFFFNL